jgi:dihydrofolate synthase / folylpolyglutamate synthase
MQIIPINTHLIHPGESLNAILDQYINQIEEQDIIAITSKIISVCQSRLIEKDQISKKQLISQEADAILVTENNPYGIYLTIKNNILIPSAGIDESNANNCYILYPEDLQKTTNLIWKHLITKHNIKHLGVIVTDSHTTPMRQGVTGICLSWCGFKPLFSYVNKPDLYGRNLKVTKVNLLDALAAASGLIMGEGNESIPITLIRGAPKISFLNREPTQDELDSIIISMEKDLYAPILTSVTWKKSI